MTEGGPKAWAAEFIGTLMFVTIGAGSVIMTNANLAPLGVFGVAAAHGLVLAVVVTAFGYVSGGHFNPAITLSFWAGGRIKSRDVLGHIVAQVLGAVAAGGLLLAMLGNTADRLLIGAPGPRADLALGRAVLIEAIFTFFLAVVYWATSGRDGQRGGGFAVGMTMFASMLIAAQLTGGALNPVRHFGPALVSGSLKNWWLYWVGPGAGAVIAGLLYPVLFLDKRFPWRLVSASDEAEAGTGPRKSTRR